MGAVTPLSAHGTVTPPERLNAHHDLSAFDCGEPAIDGWLRTHAASSEGRTARTYVVTGGGSRVIGYYAIATGSIERRELPRKKRHGAPDPVPVAILARLGVTKEWQGRELGLDLLQDALKRLAQAAEIVGLRGVVVHALNDKVAGFYREHQFQPTPIDPRTLFLAIESIAVSL